jgi:predicted nuclease of predicted toxin-antitoxin system
MRFLIDECCDPRLGAALLAAGHDAQWWREIDPGAPDTAVLAFAAAEGRIVVTHDVGIGSYVVRRGIALPGLIVIRTAPRHLATLPERLAALVAELGETLRGAITVLDDQGWRQRQLGEGSVAQGQAGD